MKPISELIEFCIINLDKPSGPTSHDAVEKIKRIFNARKAGHFGTLDPLVTGVLPIALNRACKLSNYFMKKDKQYVGKMLLHKDISEQELKIEMDKFIGKIMQKPPIKSRVKRVLRERNINKFKIINKIKRVVEFESDVQAGTYIRKLCSDLGERIGGAHMIELRRVRAGIFKIDKSYTLEEIEKAFKAYKKGDEKPLREILIPAEIIQQIITKTDVKKEVVRELLNGKPLMKKDLENEKKIPNSELISVFCKDKFIGIYKTITSSSSEDENSKIVAKPEFVKN